MRKREIDAVASILADQQNSQRTADEVAVLCIEALDDVRSRTHRLAVVGQIQYEAPGPVHTVVLGPFSSRGILDSQEKFWRATGSGTAARDAGQHLAWNPRRGTGRGRFMLAPIFRNARDAWEFWQQPPDQGHAEVAEIVATLRIAHDGPACSCGLKSRPTCRWCGQAVHHPCPLHEPGAQTHRCRTAA